MQFGLGIIWFNKGQGMRAEMPTACIAIGLIYGTGAVNREIKTDRFNQQ